MGNTFFAIWREELKNFLNNAITIILSMDYLHGIKYPEPFSINDNKDGMRATPRFVIAIDSLFICFLSFD